MEELDSFGKSLYFNHISHSASYHEDPNSTPNGEAYTKRARELLEGVVGNLNRILERDYKTVLGSPTHSDTLEVMRALKYKTQTNLKSSIKLIKKKRRDIARAVMFIDSLSNDPQKFYEDESSSDWLALIMTTIQSHYTDKWQSPFFREFAGNIRIFECGPFDSQLDLD